MRVRSASWSVFKEEIHTTCLQRCDEMKFAVWEMRVLDNFRLDNHMLEENAVVHLSIVIFPVLFGNTSNV